MALALTKTRPLPDTRTQAGQLSDTSRTSSTSCRLVALGASAGGLHAFRVILAALPKSFPVPIVIVQHLSADFPSKLPEILSRVTKLRVKQAEQGDRLQAGCVYVGPPGKHLLVNPDSSLSLSLAPKVHHSRPAANVLFESVAQSFGKEAIGVVLTGGDGDGSEGIQAIKAAGGVTIAQDVPSSQEPSMPLHAAATGDVDFVLSLPQIAATLIALVSNSPDAFKPVAALKSPPSKPLFVSPPAAPPRLAASSKTSPSMISAPRFKKTFNPDMVTEGTALERVQAAWQSAGQFSGKGAGPDEVGKLVTTALKEIDTCMEVLVVAEAALVDQNHALEHSHVLLREERLRYQALPNAISSAALVTDADSVVREANLAAAEMLGVGLRYIVGKPLLRQVHQGERLDFPRRAREAFATGGWPSALRMRTRGGLAAVTASASAMRNSQGECISLLWLMQASKMEVSEAEVSKAEVSKAKVTPQEDADCKNN